MCCNVGTFVDLDLFISELRDRLCPHEILRYRTFKKIDVDDVKHLEKHYAVSGWTDGQIDISIGTAWPLSPQTLMLARAAIIQGVH